MKGRDKVALLLGHLPNKHSYMGMNYVERYVS